MQTPRNTEGELRRSGRVKSFCPFNDPRRIVHFLIRYHLIIDQPEYYTTHMHTNSVFSVLSNLTNLHQHPLGKQNIVENFEVCTPVKQVLNIRNLCWINLSSLHLVHFMFILFIKDSTTNPEKLNCIQMNRCGTSQRDCTVKSRGILQILGSPQCPL